MGTGEMTRKPHFPADANAFTDRAASASDAVSAADDTDETGIFASEPTPNTSKTGSVANLITRTSTPLPHTTGNQ